MKFKNKTLNPEKLIGKFLIIDIDRGEMKSLSHIGRRERHDDMGLWKRGDVFFATGYDKENSRFNVRVYGEHNKRYVCGIDIRALREATAKEVADWFYRIESGEIFCNTSHRYEHAIQK